MAIVCVCACVCTCTRTHCCQCLGFYLCKLISVSWMLAEDIRLLGEKQQTFLLTGCMSIVFALVSLVPKSVAEGHPQGCYAWSRYVTQWGTWSFSNPPLRAHLFFVLGSDFFIPQGCFLQTSGLPGPGILCISSQNMQGRPRPVANDLFQQLPLLIFLYAYFHFLTDLSELSAITIIPTHTIDYCDYCSTLFYLIWFYHLWFWWGFFTSMTFMTYMEKDALLW